MQLKPYLAILVLLFPLQAVQAETSKIIDLIKVDGFNVTNLHLAIFNAQNRAAPGSKDDANRQAALLNELASTFMLANSEDGKKAATDPEVAAAIEVQSATLIAQAIIQQKLENTEVSDDALKAAYDARYANASNQEFKARHILLKDEAGAKAIIAELDKGGDFAELAKEKSTGPSKTVGGDLGWFSSDQMVKPFSQAVAALQDGDYSKTPVKTQFGWHVVLREESREVATPKLEDVKDKILQQVRGEKLTDYIRDLRANTEVEVLANKAQQE